MFGRPTEADLTGYIYLAETRPGFHKIGRTFTPKKRMGQLRSVMRTPVTLLGLIKTTHVITREHQAHSLFAKWRVGVEFFTLPPEQIERFGRLAARHLSRVDPDSVRAPRQHVTERWRNGDRTQTLSLVCGHVIHQGCHYADAHGSRLSACYQCLYAYGTYPKPFWNEPRPLSREDAMAEPLFRRHELAPAELVA